MRCLGESLLHRFGVAVMEIEHQIAGRLLMNLRRAGFQRLGWTGDGRQLFDVEHDGLGRVLGLNNRFGHDAGDRLADEAHAALGQRRPRRRFHRLAVAVRNVHRTPERPEARRFQIGIGVDRKHARHRLRLGDIDALENAVCLPATDHYGIGLAWQVDVVGVASLAAQQLRVLGTRHGLPNAELHQGETGVVERVHTLTLKHGNSVIRAEQPPRG